MKKHFNTKFLLTFCLMHTFFQMNGSYFYRMGNTVLSATADSSFFGVKFIVGSACVQEGVFKVWPNSLLTHKDTKKDPYDDTKLLYSRLFCGARLTTFLLCEWWYYKNGSQRGKVANCLRTIFDSLVFCDIFYDLNLIRKYSKDYRRNY